MALTRRQRLPCRAGHRRARRRTAVPRRLPGTRPHDPRHDFRGSLPRGPAAARKRGRDSRAQPGREARRASGRRSAGPAVRDPDAASRPGRLTGRDRLAGIGDRRLHGGVRAGRCPDPSVVARPRAGDAGLCRRARRQRQGAHFVQLSALRRFRRCGAGARRAGGFQLPVAGHWPHSTRQAERNEYTDSSSPEMVLACSG